jgi:hypothetical protein
MDLFVRETRVRMTIKRGDTLTVTLVCLLVALYSRSLSVNGSCPAIKAHINLNGCANTSTGCILHGLNTLPTHAVPNITK